jgi:hypothetical protein
MKPSIVVIHRESLFNNKIYIFKIKYLEFFGAFHIIF